jgi:hypothetical protein
MVLIGILSVNPTRVSQLERRKSNFVNLNTLLSIVP